MTLFGDEPDGQAPCPTPAVKSARSANRAGWWRQDLERTASYLMGQARSDEERAFVERLYDEAMAEVLAGVRKCAYSASSARLGFPRGAAGYPV